MSTSHASGMDDSGVPAERYQRYHEEKAKGGLALTMFGGSSNVAADSPSVFDDALLGNTTQPQIKDTGYELHRINVTAESIQYQYQ